MLKPTITLIALSLSLAACSNASAPAKPLTKLSGTDHPFASESVYFVLTDRFVDGDKTNNYESDSGWNLPLVWDNGDEGNVGFMGGDFKGLLNNADYIKDMGFSAIWMTPIVQNPADAFNGGKRIQAHGFAMDKGKAAYHGYWGVNFYKLDKHLPSADLDYAQLNQALSEKGLKTVLDVVINHGSPAYTMETVLPDYGKLYDKDGSLVADHMNLAPAQLDPDNEPLHRFFNQQPDLAELADMNVSNPEVMDYFVNAYLQWLDQGAGAFRIDTVKHVPTEAWGEFSQRIRAKYPQLFMFGEVYSFDAEEIAQYTHPDNGGMSVLDFPMKQALGEMFEQNKGFETLLPTLHLKDGPYANPYELTIFYDNHDMPRMNADDNGFINAHNWLFTARGIPVIYYGSEIGFERGKAEHKGNRNYFGQERIEQAKQHPIRAKLADIAMVRAQNVALQRGLQFNLEFKGDRASFYRVYQDGEQSQTALVLLNKGDKAQRFEISQYLQAGTWTDAQTKQTQTVAANQALITEVAPHAVKVLVMSEPVTDADFISALTQN
ncbi:alpha-amylase family glycosyl hydrolase [Paraferrimonas haliotis]|uniref:Alpha-amylase n=1 Tax=Paraferrimonas haliotis TaxID=2013866 RepID=A0AA37TRY9_9GAMM|nr:alpha-amylase family glycosyl hydrolase [Paraferrimonas haliotis]GLS83416.1 cyclomaltodextrin glucanotransferase [Paraferrimonas haliotis]